MPLVFQMQSVTISNNSMDVDQTAPPQVPTIARNRSYSHQVVSNTASSLGVASSQNHRLNFEFNLEDHIKKTRKAATYLKQILHSQQCGGHCGSTMCRRVCLVLSHLEVCEDDFCAVAGCSTTKRLVRHRMECTGVTSSSPTRSHSNSVNSNSTSNSYSDTPRTSVESTVSTLSAPPVINPLSSPQAIRSPHFCLLCVLAKADSLTPRSNAIIQDAGFSASSIMMCATDEIHSPSTGEDDRFMPVISDEIIEFSKIPFQQRHRVHHLSPMRSKTYSDSSQYLNDKIGTNSPISPMSSQPNKKLRSKSCNAATVDLDSLKKQLQFPQSPYVSTLDV